MFELINASVRGVLCAILLVIGIFSFVNIVLDRGNDQAVLVEQADGSFELVTR